MRSIESVTCIPLWDCLLVPLHGDVTDEHADAVVTDVLERIQRDECAGVLVDLSGIWTLDSHLCAVLLRMSQAARMMGAQTVLSGMSPDIAMTLEAMGFQPGGIRTMATLEDALVAMGITRTRGREANDADDDLLIRDLLQEAR